MSVLKHIYEPVIALIYKTVDCKLRLKHKTEGIEERRGNISPEQLKMLGSRHPLWVHAPSAGEVLAASGLIKEMRADGFDLPIVLTTMTDSGKAMGEKLLNGYYDLLIYHPWDTVKYAVSAIETLKPVAFILSEKELWPNTLTELKKRNIPIYLCNGMISERSWKRGMSSICKKFTAEMINCFTKLYVRNEVYAKRFISLGISEDNVITVGDSKTDVLLGMREQPSKEDWTKMLKTEKSPIFIAGSTHLGEEKIVVEAYRRLKKYNADVRLIIVPRYINQSDEICENVKDGHKVCKYSELCDDWEILVVDKTGLLFDLYGVSKAAFVGGSFTENGGHSILEPAVWGIPVQYGPHMEDFAIISEEFIKQGISCQVYSAEELFEVWLNILRDEINANNVKEKCKKYFAERAGSTKRTWDGIKKSLQELRVI